MTSQEVWYSMTGKDVKWVSMPMQEPNQHEDSMHAILEAEDNKINNYGCQLNQKFRDRGA